MSFLKYLGLVSLFAIIFSVVFAETEVLDPSILNNINSVETKPVEDKVLNEVAVENALKENELLIKPEVLAETKVSEVTLNENKSSKISLSKEYWIYLVIGVFAFVFLIWFLEYRKKKMVRLEGEFN